MKSPLIRDQSMNRMHWQLTHASAVTHCLVLGKPSPGTEEQIPTHTVSGKGKYTMRCKFRYSSQDQDDSSPWIVHLAGRNNVSHAMVPHLPLSWTLLVTPTTRPHRMFFAPPHSDLREGKLNKSNIKTPLDLIHTSSVLVNPRHAHDRMLCALPGPNLSFMTN